MQVSFPAVRRHARFKPLFCQVMKVRRSSKTAPFGREGEASRQAHYPTAELVTYRMLRLCPCLLFARQQRSTS
jgi:hypothetical protein